MILTPRIAPGATCTTPPKVASFGKIRTTWILFSLRSSLSPLAPGTSPERDTTPALCFVKNVANARCFNLAVDLGSDHFLLAVHFPTARRKMKSYTWVDWDLIRKTRAERPPHDTTSSLKTSTAQLKADVNKAPRVSV
ncbi:hypothetical protein HPB51_015630 [Rhipicephalus microplus]|uniref:Tick transposon n=1 Tax=Rhipicephalus microplus TaxID=6941 RepID=A0A9J6DA67_RHIMP|nr:hypothetical protein HPB51_015630 [Rhipicephalus microplus]